MASAIANIVGKRILKEHVSNSFGSEVRRILLESYWYFANG